jgi:nucleotide-binding universal stress UspA family protein
VRIRSQTVTKATKTPGVRFRSILCAVDFSAHARHALRLAVAVAKQFDGRVTALFVNDPLLLAAARRLDGADVVDCSRRELTKFIAQAVGEQSPQVIALVAAGNPAEEILKTARRLRSDVVVIGSQGLSGVPRLFFGSTTEQVLRRATIPVFAIPPLKGRLQPPTDRLHVERIVAPIDLAGEWHSDAIRAASIATQLGVPLLLAHVLRPSHVPECLRLVAPVAERERIRKATRVLERVTRHFAAGVEATCHVSVGDPAEQIAALTRRGAPLLVMSLRGTAGLWGRRGAIAYRVLTHSSTPVLALPRRQIGGRLSARLKRTIDETMAARDRIEIAGIDALLSAAAGKSKVRAK